LDVTQAKSNLAQTESLIPVLEKGLRESNNRLCVLLGTPPRDLQPEIGPAPIPAAPVEVVVGIPAELLRRRPDIRRAERQVAVQSAQIGVAAAELFPAFTINGSIGWQAKNFPDLFSSAANVGAIGPAFNWNILHYGRIRNNINAQDAKFQELAILYQETVLKANAEAEDAIVGFLKAQEQVRKLQEGVTASERSVELALTQYREGATDFNRVFNLQSVLVSQQDELAAAQASVTLSLVRIYKTLGGGWQVRYGQGAPHEFVAPEELPRADMVPAPAPAINDGAQEQ
jgi:NodT family efflux transporter outer membrane factor (OMF) lipoprotein